MALIGSIDYDNIAQQLGVDPSQLNERMVANYLAQTGQQPQNIDIPVPQDQMATQAMQTGEQERTARMYAGSADPTQNMDTPQYNPYEISDLQQAGLDAVTPPPDPNGFINAAPQQNPLVNAIDEFSNVVGEARQNASSFLGNAVDRWNTIRQNPGYKAARDQFWDAMGQSGEWTTDPTPSGGIGDILSMGVDALNDQLFTQEEIQSGDALRIQELMRQGLSRPEATAKLAENKAAEETARQTQANWQLEYDLKKAKQDGDTEKARLLKKELASRVSSANIETNELLKPLNVSISDDDIEDTGIEIGESTANQDISDLQNNSASYNATLQNAGVMLGNRLGMPDWQYGIIGQAAQLAAKLGVIPIKDADKLFMDDVYNAIFTFSKMENFKGGVSDREFAYIGDMTAIRSLGDEQAIKLLQRMIVQTERQLLNNDLRLKYYSVGKRVKSKKMREITKAMITYDVNQNKKITEGENVEGTAGQGNNDTTEQSKSQQQKDKEKLEELKKKHGAVK